MLNKETDKLAKEPLLNDTPRAKPPLASLKLNVSKPLDQYDTDLQDDMGDEGQALTPHNIGLMRNPGSRADQVKQMNSLRKLNKNSPMFKPNSGTSASQ
jgi:hypothetical protein